MQKLNNLVTFEKNISFSDLLSWGYISHSTVDESIQANI